MAGMAWLASAAIAEVDRSLGQSILAAFVMPSCWVETDDGRSLGIEAIIVGSLEESFTAQPRQGTEYS